MVSHKALRAWAVVAVIAAIAISSWLLPDRTAAQSSTLAATPSLWRGGDEQPVSWEGDSPAISIEFSPDKGLSWLSLGASGPSPLKVKIPKVDSNAATIRVLLEDGSLRTSDAFVVDSTPPVSAVTGRAFMSQGKGEAGKGRVMVPFDALGSDVVGVSLRYSFDGRDEVNTEIQTIPDALKSGFPAPADGTWAITLLARDRVGNVEQKGLPDIPRFVVDTVAPVVSVGLSVADYAIGGDKISVTYSAQDDNLDLNTLKFEYLVGDVIREPIDFSPIEAAATREWLLPREDHKDVRIRMSVSDRAGNTSTATTTPFALFSGRPQAVIVNEEDGGDSRIDFQIALLNAESLKHIDEDIRVDLYVGAWDAAALRWAWDTQNPHRDLELRMGADGNYRLTYAGPNISKAFAARLVVGNGNNRLTESVPTNTTAPEAAYRGLTPVSRIKLIGLSQGRSQLVFGSGQPVEFQYSVPDTLIRDSRLAIEYSTNSGETWLPVTPAPVPVQQSTRTDSYLWTNPPVELEFAMIRAVTMLDSGTIEFRVADLMSGGLIIDGNAPKAEIIRVLDNVGRPLVSGEYTNSPYFDVEWRATDTGGSGMAEAILWDDADFAAGRAPEGRVWNPNEFAPNSTAATDVPRKLDFTNPVARVNFGKVEGAVGKVGFILEGVDRAGNRRFRLGRPEADTPRAFSLNIDYLPPRVVLTEQPAGGEFQPGAQVRIGWVATDDIPDPRVADSLGPSPVSIYVIDDTGRQSLIATGLEATGSMLVTIPALSDTTIRYLVTARDRAGNTSGAETDATSRTIRIQNAAVPEVRLRPLSAFQTNLLAFQWDQVRGRADELAELRLWMSVDAGRTWTAAGTFEPASEITFDLPTGDADYCFSLTAKSAAGLAEPDPRGQISIESTWIVDTTPPEVSLEIIPRRALYFVGDEPPLVRARIIDAHYVPATSSLMVTRTTDGAPQVDAQAGRAGSDFQGGAWVEFPIALGGDPQTITITLSSIDIRGNTSSAKADLEVRIRPRWQIEGFSGAPPYYARSARDVVWTSRGEGAGTGRVSIYLRPVVETESGWRPLETGMILLGDRVPDSGTFSLPNGLPDVTGDYTITLEPHDTAEPVGFIDADRMFRIVQPKPAAILSPMPEALVLDGGVSVYAGFGAAPLTLRAIHLASNNPYELPIRTTVLRWRRTGMDGVTGPWSTIDATPVTTSTTTIGTYSTSFAPPQGEGRYEVVPSVTDTLGFTSGFEGDALVLVFDGGPPVVTIASPSGDKSVYTDEDIARLVFSARDPLLDIESISLEYRTFGNEMWQTLPASRAIDGQAATFANGAFAPQFPQPGRYLIRIRAADLVGQTGYGHLSAPVYAGSGNYIAVRPIRSDGVAEEDEYTSSLVSRRADFRIQVEPIRPWEEGLRSLTLWWRWRESEEDTQPSAWTRIDYNDRNLIGEQTRVPQFEGDRQSYLNSLPFVAPHSGRYEFIVTSESAWGQREEPRIPGPTSVPEMWCNVHAEPYAVTTLPLMAADGATDEVIDGLAKGRIAPGQSYLLAWTITTCVNEPHQATDFTMSWTENNGTAWTNPVRLTQARADTATGDPSLSAGTWIVKTANAEVSGQPRIVRTYHTIWTAPEELKPGDLAPSVQFRIASTEQPTPLMPAFNRVSTSRAYHVGLLPAPATVKTNGYYDRLMQEGNRATDEGRHADALDYYRQARAQSPTAESNRAIEAAEAKLKIQGEPVPPSVTPKSDPPPTLAD